MTDRLTWFELSALQPGALVAFGCSYGINSAAGPLDVPPGTVCTIVETGLNEIWGGLIVRPVSDADREPLLYAQDAHNGCIFIDDTPEPGGYGDDADPRWGALSPFMLHEQVECI